MSSNFKIVGVGKVEETKFARKKRASLYDDLVAEVVKLKVGQTLSIAPPKGAKLGQFKVNVGASMRLRAQPQMAGRVLTRTDTDGNVVICHVEQGEKPARSGKAPVKASVAKKGAKKGGKKGGKKAAKAPAAATAPATPAVPPVPASQPTFNPTAG